MKFVYLILVVFAMASSQVEAQISSNEVQYWYDFHPRSVLSLGNGFDPSRPLEPKAVCLEYNFQPGASPVAGLGQPVVTRTVSPGVTELARPDGGALSTEVDMYLVRSMNEYRQALGIDVSVEASYLGFSGGGAFQLAENQSMRHNSLTILVRARSEYARRLAGVPHLTAFAEQMLRDQEYGRFISICGSHYATIERRAALAVMEIRVDSVDQSTRQSIEASVHAGGGFGAMSASLRTKVTSEISRATSEGRVNARIVAQGGEGIGGAAELIAGLATGGDPLEGIRSGLRSFVQGFRPETAAPISYAVARIPFLPEGFGLLSDIAKRDRMLAIADLYRQTSRDFINLRRISNREDSRWRGIASGLLEMVRTELPALEGQLERIRATHQTCAGTQENWEAVCVVPDASYTIGLDIVLGILAVTSEAAGG